MDLIKATAAVARSWHAMQVAADEEPNARYLVIATQDLALITAMASLFLEGRDG